MENESGTGAEVSLKGNALRIFWYLLHQRTPAGIRDIQRALHLSSPSLVRHHLNQLQKRGLVRELEEGIVAVKNGRVDALKSFVRFGHLALPRQVFYLTFFAVLFAYFALLWSRALTAESILLFGALLFGLLSSGYEVWQTWRSAPW